MLTHIYILGLTAFVQRFEGGFIPTKPSEFSEGFVGSLCLLFSVVYLNLFSLKALSTTQTLDIDIANAANIGDN